MFKIDKLKKLVSTVAPLAGMALGGPLGATAGKMIQQALGVDSDDEALKMLQTDPDALLKLKIAEADFEARMRELDITEAEIEAGDRNSARDMIKTTGMGFQALLTAIFLTGYMILIALFFTGDIDVTDDWQKGQLGILIGVLTAAVPQMLNFWFGSSQGSKNKTQLIGKKP